MSQKYLNNISETFYYKHRFLKKIFLNSHFPLTVDLNAIFLDAYFQKRCFLGTARDKSNWYIWILFFTFYTHLVVTRQYNGIKFLLQQQCPTQVSPLLVMQTKGPLPAGETAVLPNRLLNFKNWLCYNLTVKSFVEACLSFWLEDW